MSLRRYKMIDHFFQVHVSEEGETSMHKVHPLLKLLSEFDRVYKPSNRLSLDESVAPFAGRFKYLTFNPQKPDKWGIRIIGLADSTTGFCLSLLPQLGREVYDYLDVADMDALVINQMKEFATPGSSLYVSNYYCSIDLAKKLLLEGFNVTGTYRLSRKDVLKLIKDAVVKKKVVKKVVQTKKINDPPKPPVKDVRYFKSNSGI